MVLSNVSEKILECEKLTHATYDNDGTKEIIIPTFFRLILVRK